MQWEMCNKAKPVCILDSISILSIGLRRKVSGMRQSHQAFAVLSKSGDSGVHLPKLVPK